MFIETAAIVGLFLSGFVYCYKMLTTKGRW